MSARTMVAVGKRIGGTRPVVKVHPKLTAAPKPAKR